MSRSISLALCSSLVACGDPLYGADYFGEPLLTMSGEVLSEEVVGERDGEIRIALLWTRPDEITLQFDQGAELDTATIINWSMTLYHPPDDSLLGEDGAIGIPVLYIDSDGSQSWNEERIIGGSSTAFVLYLRSDIPEPPGGHPDESLVPQLGYNVVSTPDCSMSGPVPVPILTEPDRVNLELGDLFFSNLPDTDCDGTTGEWDALCEYGCGDGE
jgi:hypothetical protein